MKNLQFTNSLLLYILILGSANPCNVQNGGCSEKCSLDVAGKVVCGCRAGKIVLSDGRCVPERAVRNCTGEEFQCTSGPCILYELSCDAIQHCPGMYVHWKTKDGKSIMLELHIPT